MKKYILLLLISAITFAQNNPAKNPNGFFAGTGTMQSTAIGQFDSTSKGFLFPRMTTTQRNAISSPATSLVIYNTTSGKYNYYDGSAWVTFGGGSQSFNDVLTVDNESTTQDAIFRLDADKFLKINRADQSIEFWDLTIDAVNPLSYWSAYGGLIKDNAGNSALLEAGGFTLENSSGSRTDNTTETVFTDAGGSIRLIKPNYLTQSSNIYLKETPNPSVDETLAFLSDITGGATNLGYTPSPTNGIVTSDTGTDATLPLATTTNAGLLAPADKSILNATTNVNSGDNATNTQYSGLAASKEDTANKQTDLTASATKFPTVNAVNTGLATKEPIITATTSADYYRGDKTFATLNKAAVGLSNVDNTSDASKPISTATQTALDLKQNALAKYGTIYSKNFWNNLSDFTSNSAGVSTSGGKLVFTGGTIQNTASGTNAQLSSFLRINGYTGLSKWAMTIKVKVNQVPSATSYGFSCGLIGKNTFGVNSESSALGFFNMSSTGTLKGKASLVVGIQNNLKTSSSTVLTFSQNDYIELRVERNLQNITVSARNITTSGGITSTSFDYNTNFANGAADPFIPNSGTFVIGQHGGDFIVDDIKIESSTIKAANLMVIGDSKVNYNAPIDFSLGQLLNQKYQNIVVNAGPIDKTQEVVNKLPEIVALAPKQVVLAIGRNDIATGVSSATWQANMVTIDNTLTAAGIATYWTNGIKETVDQSALKSYIDSQFSGRVINTFDATNYSACLSSDNIHPSIVGHQQVVNAIIASGLIVDYSNLPNNYQQSSTVTDLRYTGNIFSSGGAVTRPTTVNVGDIILPDGGSISSAYATAATWYGKVRPFEAGIQKSINSFTSGASGQQSFNWYGANGTVGTEVLIASMTDRGNIIAKPSSTSSTLFSRTDISNTGMFLVEAGKGLASAYVPTLQSTVGQYGQIIPFTTSYATETRNYSRIGQIDTYVSGSTDASQVLAQRTDALGSASFFGDGVQFPNMTSTQRDALGKVIGGYMTSLGGSVTTATVNFSGGGGTGAAATATISGGQIVGIVMTNKGSGYTSAPTISFTGDGTASSAVCVLSMSLLRKGLIIYNTTTDKMQCWNGTTWNDLF